MRKVGYWLLVLGLCLYSLSAFTFSAFSASFSATTSIAPEMSWSPGQPLGGLLGRVVSASPSTDPAIAAGSYHSFYLKSDGTLWAWGLNANGQLGLGDTTKRTSPTQVGTSTNWSAIASGDYHSLGLKLDGTLWAWGYNYYGGLGLGDTTQRNSPTQVGTLTNWSAIAAGYHYSLGLKSDGTLWAWGWNEWGQLGQGDTTQRNSPTQVSIGMQTAIINSVTDGTNTITTLDGTKYLQDADSTVSITLGTTPTAAPTLYYDDDDTPLDGSTATATGSGTSWSATIPASDANVYDGAGIRFCVDVDGTKYYRTGTTSWSYIVDGATPTNVGCSTPANNATGVSTSTALVALTATDAGSGLDSYYFQLATDNNFTQNVQTSGWRSGASWGPSLAGSTTYYWRVKARDNVGNESGYCGHSADTPGYGKFTTAAAPANNPPTASFTYSPTSPTTNSTIQFTDTSTDNDGTIVSWYWYFHDGTSSNLQNPTHQFSSAGEYWVSLDITDDDGASDMENVVIIVTKFSTTLTATPSTFTLQPGNSTTLTAMLTSGGAPLAGKTLTWSATSGGIVPSSGTTDSLGQVMVTYAAPSYEDNVAVTATFVGDNQYLSSSGSSSCKIESALPIQADVEIKPDTLQIGSEGEWVTCYIELPTNNAENIDVSSIRLEGRIQVDPAAPTEIGDYDNDGVPDLMVKFDRASVENIVALGPVTLTVTGNDLGGTTFIGSDKIDVIKTGSGALASFSFTVPGEAPEVREEVYNPDLEITTEAGDNRVTVSVSSDISTGTTLVVNVDNAVIPISSMEELVVLFDNENIELADDYEDVLDATNENSAEYLVLLGAEGIQVLVSIPSFSVRTVTIARVAAAAPPSELPSEEVVTPPAEGIPLATLLAIAGVMLAIFISAVLIGRRQARRGSSSQLIEHGLSSMRLQEVDIFSEIRAMRAFTIPELIHKTGASNILAWRTVQKLIERGLVQPTDEVKPPAAGRGKPSTVYRYVGD